MRKLEKVIVGQALCCLLLAGASGCGDDSKPLAKLDAGVDRTNDVAAADSAKADTVSTDAPLTPDAVEHDVPSSLDVARGETAVDAAEMDTGLVLDAAAVDAAPTIDVAAGETNAFDGSATVDGASMTSASITFRLQNQGTETVYLRMQCWIPFEVTSLADGAVYANGFICACACADSSCTAAVMCGPCAPPSGVAIAAGQTQDLSWQARKSTVEKKLGTSGAFDCVAHAPIATGAYRLAVVVYPTEADAVAETNGRIVQQSFALGTTHATVAVAIP